MDHSGGLDEVVRGLERGIATADDENPLVDEVLRIDRHLVVALGLGRTLDGRHVGPGDAGGDDDTPRSDNVATLVRRHELAAVRARYAADAGVVADVQAVLAGEVVQVADEIVGRWEVTGV